MAGQGREGSRTGKGAGKGRGKAARKKGEMAQVRAAVTAQAHSAITGRRRGVSSTVTRVGGGGVGSGRPANLVFTLSRLARVYSFAFNP